MIGPGGTVGSFRFVDCPLCGSGERTTVWSGLTDLQLGHPGEFRIDRCRDCAVDYLNPQPSGETLAAYYGPTERAAYPDNRVRGAKRLKPALRYALHKERNYPLRDCRPPGFMTRLLAGRTLRRTTDCFRYVPFHGQGRLLDVGCGSGQYIKTMETLGWRAEGLTMAPGQAEALAAAHGLPIHTGAIDRLAPSLRFDAITLWHVLEHLPNPVEDARRLRDLLAPGGWLGIGVPVMDSREAELLGPSWMGFEVPRHLVFFTRDRLRRFIEETGFEFAGMFSEWRTKSLEMSLHRARLPFPWRLLLGSKRLRRMAVGRWARRNRNGIVVAWARKPSGDDQ